MFVERWKKITLALLLLAVALAAAWQRNAFSSLAQVSDHVQHQYYLWRAGRTETCTPNAPAWLTTVTKWARQHDLPAGQIAFLSPKGVLAHCEYGFRDGLAGTQPVLPTTRFKFASISKLFTAEAVLDLVRQGKLHFNDPIIPLLPVAAPSTPPADPRITKITIEDLLAHTGGFDRDRSGDAMFMARKFVWCPKRIEKLWAQTLDFDPATERHYSNLGYCLLGAIVAKETGQPFEDYMRQHFDFAARGLRYAHNNAYFPDEVTYSFQKRDLDNYMKVFAFDALPAPAGLTGSAMSLVRAADEISKKPRPNVLTHDTRLPCDPETYLSCYALGSFVLHTPAGDVNVRSGSLPAFTGTVIMQPQFGTVAFLSNSRNVAGGKDIEQQLETLLATELLTHKD